MGLKALTNGAVSWLSNGCSVDKADVLSRYVVSSTQNGQYIEFTNKSDIHLSYPNTCMPLPLTPGCTDGASYTLNNENYRYVFFIDNDWNVVSTYKGSEAQPYENVR